MRVKTGTNLSMFVDGIINGSSTGPSGRKLRRQGKTSINKNNTPLWMSVNLNSI